VVRRSGPGWEEAVCFGTGYVREAQSRRAQIVVTTCSRVPLTLPSSFPPRHYSSVDPDARRPPEEGRLARRERSDRREAKVSHPSEFTPPGERVDARPGPSPPSPARLPRIPTFNHSACARCRAVANVSAPSSYCMALTIPSRRRQSQSERGFSEVRTPSCSWCRPTCRL
jgi:hypothetical protein